MPENFDFHKFHSTLMGMDLRSLELFASDPRHGSQQLAAIRSVLRLKRHKAAVASDRDREDRQVADDAMTLRSIEAAEASARWAKWSMGISLAALILAIAAFIHSM